MVTPFTSFLSWSCWSHIDYTLYQHSVVVVVVLVTHWLHPLPAFCRGRGRGRVGHTLVTPFTSFLRWSLSCWSHIGHTLHQLSVVVVVVTHRSHLVPAFCGGHTSFPWWLWWSYQLSVVVVVVIPAFCGGHTSFLWWSWWSYQLSVVVTPAFCGNTELKRKASRSGESNLGPSARCQSSCLHHCTTRAVCRCRWIPGGCDNLRTAKCTPWRLRPAAILPSCQHRMLKG